jgi:hypothetical protein
MAMKAQNQCRMTLETLSTIKNPPVVYAKQANIAHGPQQVNNGTVPSRAEEKINSPNKLLEPSNEIPMDTGAPGTAGGSNSQVEAVGNRPAREPLKARPSSRAMPSRAESGRSFAIPCGNFVTAR